MVRQTEHDTHSRRLYLSALDIESIGRHENKMFAKIKSTFPTWPDDVIDQWLVFHSMRPGFGWPPPNPLRSHGWYYVLSRRPISWWQGVSWEKQAKKLSLDSLSPSDRMILEKMIDANFRGKNNEYSRISDSKERMRLILSYLSEHGILPRPPLAFENSDGLRFIDGSHRVTALIAYQGFSEGQIKEDGYCSLQKHHDMWIGRHHTGEALDFEPPS